MPDITIQGTLIEFPDSGTDPNWAPAVIQFAEAVEAALSGVVGTYDVAPRSMIIDATPTATATDIPSLSFSTSQIRGAFINYTVYRTTTDTTVSEAGTLQLVYNDSSGSGLKWEISREAVGDASVEFTVEDTGQVQVTLTALSGSDHTGQLNYSAAAMQQEY